jgi:hypothetical protein
METHFWGLKNQTIIKILSANLLYTNWNISLEPGVLLTPNTMELKIGPIYFDGEY